MTRALTAAELAAAIERLRDAFAVVLGPAHPEPSTKDEDGHSR